MNLLNSKPIIELNGDEFLPKEGITFAQQVNEYFISQGGKADSSFGEVLLDIKGIQNSKQHGMSRIKAVAFAAVKDVLEKGVEILPMDYHGVHDKKQMTGMIAAPIIIGVEKYICVVEVIANLEVNRLYVHEAFVIKTLFEDAASNSVHGRETTSPHPQEEIAKVLQNYVCTNKNKGNIKSEDLLNGEPIVKLSGDEFLPVEGKTFVQQVEEFFQKQGGIAHSAFGIIVLDKKGIKNDINHGIGRLKSVSFAAVKDVLEKGIVINPLKQYRTNNKKNPTGMIAAPILIGGEKYICVVEIIANRKTNRLYIHEVTLTKKLQADVADTNAVHGESNLVTHPQGEVAKVLQNYVSENKNSTKNNKN